MTINTERLKTDAAYWDECGAPEWATAYGLAGNLNIPVWYNVEKYQHVDGLPNEFIFEKQGTYNLNQIRLVKTKPLEEATPGGDGNAVPPVGTSSANSDLFIDCIHPNPKNWEVVAHRGGDAIVWVPSTSSEDQSEVYLLSPGDFKSRKEQRQREELAKLVREAYLEGASEHVGGLTAITDAILSRYNLEPKP